MDPKPPREVWVAERDGRVIDGAHSPKGRRDLEAVWQPDPSVRIVRYVPAEAIERLLVLLREGGVDPARCWCIGRRREDEHSGICAEIHGALAELDDHLKPTPKETP